MLTVTASSPLPSGAGRSRGEGSRCTQGSGWSKGQIPRRSWRKPGSSCAPCSGPSASADPGHHRAGDVVKGLTALEICLTLHRNHHEVAPSRLESLLQLRDELSSRGQG